MKVKIKCKLCKEELGKECSAICKGKNLLLVCHPCFDEYADDTGSAVMESE